MADNIQEPTSTLIPDTSAVPAPVEQPINPMVDKPPAASAAPAAPTAPTAPVPAPAPATSSTAAEAAEAAEAAAVPAAESSQKAEDAPSLYIKQRLTSLVYWENPYRSGTVLAALLGGLVLTQYYSLLQIAAAFFTIVTGVNLVYVNAHKQGQRMFNGKAADQVTNPHSQRFKSTYIPRERVVRTAQVAVDVIEAAVQQVTALVLIEDSWRSARAVGIAYFVWTLSTYVSTKYLVGVFIVGAFSVPRIYSQNQELIDSQVAQYSAHGRALAEQYGSVASSKAKELYEQAVNTVSKKKTA